MKKSILSLLTLLICITAPSWLSADAGESYQGWVQYRTEHFRFLYEPRDEEAVQIFVQKAEGVYQRLSAYFQHAPREITCILRGRYDAANGSFSPLPDKLELFISAPLTASLGVQGESWAEMILTHELTHYFHITQPQGFFGALSRVFGSGVIPGQSAFMPGWYIEGITTNLETRYTSGGRGRSPYFLAIPEAMARENQLFSHRQSEYSGPGYPSGRIYIAGYLIVDYLMDTYGEEVFQKINREYIKFPFWGVNPAIRKVTGKSYREIYRDMEASLIVKTGFAPPRETSSAILADRYFSQPGISLPLDIGRGRTLTYETPPGKTPALVIREGKTGLLLHETKARLTSENAFTSDKKGTTVLFSSFSYNPRHGSGETLTAHIYQWKPETGKVKQLPDSAHLHQPALSPDGNRFLAVERQGSFSRLVLITLGSPSREVLYEEQQALITQPQWSPLGNTAAITINRQGRQKIALLELGDVQGKREPLYPAPQTPLPQWNPRFDREGALYFTIQEEKNLVLMSYLEQKLSRIADDPNGIFEGRKIGTEILYLSPRAQGIFLHSSLPEETRSAESRPERKKSPTPGIETVPLEGKKYTDYPRFLFWFPYPAYNLAAPKTPWGIGVGTMGSSYLGKTGWQSFLNWFPESSQLTGQASLFLRGWGHATSLTITQEYTERESFALADTRITLNHSAPLISRDTPSFRFSLNLNGSATWLSQQGDTTPFSFQQLITQQNLHYPTRKEAILTLGTSFNGAGPTPNRSLYPGSVLHTAVTLQYQPVFLDRTRSAVSLLGQTYGGTNIGTSHLRGTLQASWTPDGLPWSRTLPRGFTPEILTESVPVSFAAAFLKGQLWTAPRADFLFTLGNPDLPLPLLPFHIASLGAGIHAEGTGGITVEGTARMDRAVYAGGEISMVFGYLSWITLPFTLGWNTRISFDNPGSAFNPESTALYMALSLNTALDSDREILYTGEHNR